MTCLWRRLPAGTRLLLALLVLSLCIWMPGCSSSGDSGTAQASTEESDGDKDKKGEGEDGKKDDEDKETAVPVEVTSLGRGEIESVLRSTTNLEAESSVKVYSQAARLVQELLVEEGDHVEKGQVLLRLLDDEQRSALARIKSQHEKESREYDRQKRLFMKELISEELFNNATYEMDQLAISMEDAERELSYAEVRAPFSGTITGRLVNLGDQVTVGQHLFDLVDFDSIVARIYVPEKDLPRLKVGQTAWVTSQAGDQPTRGRVQRISPIVDPQTGTVKVTIAFRGRGDVRPGMYVDVNLVTEIHHDALLVPKRALIYDQDQIFVYRLGEERRVERLLIESVLEDRENVEPTSGLEEGDEIVIAGQAGLKDNALVRLPGDPDPDAEDDEDKSENDEDADTVVASKESE
ncbi:MAG: efflux RND transporter periplasmic adaptor subunit [Planctomycetota bacterium]